MNRFSNNSVSRFDPLSWEDVSRVPMYKRAQHNAQQQAMSELDTNVGAIDNLGVHNEQAQSIQQEYIDKLEQMTSSLASEGVNGFNTQDVLKLNSQYKKDWSPGGRAYALNQAKITQKANDARSMKYAAAQNWDLQDSQSRLDKFNTDYKGIDENGNVIQPGQFYMPKNVDFDKEIESRYKGAAHEVDQYAEGKGWQKVQRNGQMVWINKSGQTVTSHNDPQMAAIYKGVEEQIANNSEWQRAAGIKGTDLTSLNDMYAGKYGFKHETETSKEQMKQIRKTGSGKTEKIKPDNDLIIPVKNSKTFASVADITTDTKNLENDILNLNGKPNEVQLVAEKEAQIRDNENFQFEADREALQNQEYVNLKAQTKIVLENIHLQPLQDVITKIESIPDLNDEQKKVLTYYKDSLQSLTENQSLPTNDKASGVDVLNTLGAAATLPGYEVMENIKQAVYPVNQMYDKLTSNYVSSHGRQLFEIRTLNSNKDDREFQGQIGKFINNNSNLVPEMINGATLFSSDFKNKADKSTKETLTKEAFGKLTDGTSSKVTTNFSTDGNNVSMTIRGILPEGYKFNTKYGDGISDKTIQKGGESAEFKVNLTTITNGIHNIDPNAVKVVRTSNLSQNNQVDLIKKIYTSTIKPTYFKDKLGKHSFGSGIFREYSSKVSNTGIIDGLLDKSGSFTTLYDIGKDGEPLSPIKVSDINNKFNSTQETVQFLNKFNVIGTTVNKINKMSVDDALLELKENNIDKGSVIYKALIYGKAEGKTKLNDIFGTNGDTQPTSEQKNILFNYILNSNLIITDPADLIGLNN